MIVKKTFIVLLGLSLIFTTSAFATNLPLQKFKRGVVNIVTSPVEIPKEIRAHWIAGSEKTFHILVWIFCGVVKGTVMMTARMGSGVWDVATFPLRIPSNYESLIKPDSVFDQWPKRQAGVVYKNLGDK